MKIRIYWIVFLLSIALLSYQISVIRILSYMHWHHFATMVISVSLLGFGASGILLVIFQNQFLLHWHRVIFVSTIGCTIFLAWSPFFFSLISFEPFHILWNPFESWRLILFYLITFLTFFSGALVIGLAFILFVNDIGRLYFANLIGSGIGCFTAIFLMYAFSPNQLPFFSSSIAVIAILLMISNIKISRIAISFCVVFVVLVAWFVTPQQPTLSQYKSLSKTLLLPETKIIHKKLSPLGTIEVVKGPANRYAPGLSISFDGKIPSQDAFFCDGEWIGSVVDAHDSSTFELLSQTTSFLPYIVSNPSSVLVVGSGTGTDLQLAVQQVVKKVVGIEMNEKITELLEYNYPQETNYLLKNPKVRIINSEARSFLANDTAKYDLIVTPLFEGQTSSAAGAYALFENYLFTGESFDIMFQHLTENGMLMVSTWMTNPPQSSLKMIAMLIETLRRNGIVAPTEHLIAIRSWGTTGIIIKKSQITNSEIKNVRRFCTTKGFDLIHLPTIKMEDTNHFHNLERDFLYEGTQAIITNRINEFAKIYPFDILPATDEHPYFSHFFKWSHLSQILQIYGTGQVPFFELSYFFLLLTLGQLIVLSIILLLIPVLLRREQYKEHTAFWKTILYFGGIGVGYMLIEVLMIQKFILFLGHPIYSVSTIIAAILIFSGVGSFFSEWITRKLKLQIIFLLLLILLLGCTIFLTPILKNLLWLNFAFRVAVCFIILAPIGFLMGIPFPMGLKNLNQTIPNLLPWAWGVNGFASVVSSTAVVFMAVEFGFVAVLVIAMVVYTIAMVT